MTKTGVQADAARLADTEGDSQASVATLTQANPNLEQNVRSRTSPVPSSHYS